MDTVRTEIENPFLYYVMKTTDMGGEGGIKSKEGWGGGYFPKTLRNGKKSTKR